MEDKTSKKSVASTRRQMNKRRGGRVGVFLNFFNWSPKRIKSRSHTLLYLQKYQNFRRLIFLPIRFLLCHTKSTKTVEKSRRPGMHSCKSQKQTTNPTLFGQVPTATSPKVPRPTDCETWCLFVEQQVVVPWCCVSFVEPTTNWKMDRGLNFLHECSLDVFE